MNIQASDLPHMPMQKKEEKKKKEVQLRIITSESHFIPC